VLGSHDTALAAARADLADLYDDAGYHTKAAPLYERALAVQEVLLGASDQRVVHALYRLAVIYRDQGLYRRANPLFERALHSLAEAKGKAMAVRGARALDNSRNAEVSGYLTEIYETETGLFYTDAARALDPRPGNPDQRKCCAYSVFDRSYLAAQKFSYHEKRLPSQRLKMPHVCQIRFLILPLPHHTV